jgi:hypothetical protein
LDAASDPVVGADVVELDEPDSPLLAGFDSVFDSALDSVFASLPAFFSVGAESEPELLPDSEPELLLLGA